MTGSAFELQPRGPYQFNIWIAKSRVATPFGEFTVEAHTPLRDKNPPDERMLRQASELTEFTRTNADAILDKIYEHYQIVSSQPDWLDFCDVPAGLTRDQLAPYLEALSLVVDREEGEPTIYIVPQWDEEHSIYLALRDGRVEFQEI